MEKKYYIVGFLSLAILIGSIIIISMDNVRLRVDADKSTFYVKLLDENGEPYGRWLVAGREYNYLYDGTKKLNRDAKNIEVKTDIGPEIVKITRTTPYIRGPKIIDTYEFNGSIEDEKLFPISHKVEVINASGFFYRYEVRNLEYSGNTFKLNGEQTTMDFGKNMKIEWWEGYRLGWVYKTGSMYVKSEKITTDYEVFNVRLFDPLEISEISKEYNSTSKEIIIKDDKDKILTKIKLNTPLALQLIDQGDGIDQLIAETYRENFDPRCLKIADNMETYDLKNNNKPLNRTFRYKWKNLTGYVEKPVYYANCTEVSKNHTICESIQNGTKLEPVHEWIDLDSKGNLPKDNVTIGHFTDVQRGDSVEWVITICGNARLIEYGSFNETFQKGLVACYPMDESSGIDFPDNSGNSLDGTWYGGGSWVSGKIGNAYNISSVAMGRVDDDALLDFNQSMAACLWTWVHNYDFYGTYFWKEQNNTDQEKAYSLYQVSTTGKDAFGIYQSNDIQITCYPNVAILKSQWIFLCAVADASVGTMRVFHNNVQVGANCSYDGTMRQTTGILKIGYFLNQYNLAGLVDEIIFYNRSLSDSELDGLWNGGAANPCELDTCTAPASGNWSVNCADNCSWTTSLNVPEDLILSGTGKVILNATMSFTTPNRYIYINPSCELEIQSGGEIS